MATEPLAFVAEIDDAAVRKALAAAGRDPGHLSKSMASAFRDIVATFGKEFQRKRLGANTGGSVLFRNPTPGGLSGALQRRTGNLGRSFGQRVKTGAMSHVQAWVGFGPPATPWVGPARHYITIHEKGGLIFPVRRTFLTIPAEDNLTGAGDTRYATVPDMGGDAVFIINAARTGGVVKLGRDGPVMFYLTTGPVRIPPRLNFEHDWEEFQPRAIKRVGTGITEALEAAAAEARRN